MILCKPCLTCLFVSVNNFIYRRNIKFGKGPSHMIMLI